MSDVMAAVNERYPQLRALLGIPEIGDLLVRAVDPQAPFSQQEFERQLHETYWWKTTPAPTRDAIIQGVEDPATLALSTNKTHNDLLDWALDMGVAMDSGTRDWISGAMQSKGENINDTTAQLGLRQWLRANPAAMTPGGRLDGLTKSIYGMARKDYFLPVENWWAQGWAIGIATGEVDEAALRQHLLAQSANAFPQLGDWISQGMSPSEIINPLRQVAADELEVDINQIDIGRPEWQMLTGVPNAQGRDQGSATAQAYRLPTRSEITEQARRQSQWWETSKGRQADASMSRTLLSAFGKRAF